MFLSGSNYITISVCLPILYVLKDNLKVTDIGSDFDKTLKKVLNDSVAFYCQRYELLNKKEYAIATFLDPSFEKFSRVPENE
jgi:hypothetical protein